MKPQFLCFKFITTVWRRVNGCLKAVLARICERLVAKCQQSGNERKIRSVIRFGRGHFVTVILLTYGVGEGMYL